MSERSRRGGLSTFVSHPQKDKLPSRGPTTYMYFNSVDSFQIDGKNVFLTVKDKLPNYYGPL